MNVEWLVRLGVSTLVMMTPMGATQANPLLNGNFEQEDNGSLAWWGSGRFVPQRIPNTTVGSENLMLRFVWDTISHGEGKGCLRIDCKGLQEGEPRKDVATATLGAPVNETRVKPETDYTLSWFWKGAGMTEKSFVSVVLFAQSSGPLGPPPEGSRFLKMFAGDLKTESADWQRGELTFRTPPETGWVQLRINVNGGDAGRTFSVWLDDFALAPADGAEPPDAPQAPDTWVARRPPTNAGRFGLPGFEPVPPSMPYGSRIQRTMTLLTTSTPERRNRVKILFYGQSIIAQNWWRGIVADLRERFPHADIEAVNPSIGGFMSDRLKDTMHADCYPADADLICFHDYARSETDMAEMFAAIRRLTTAEVLVFTHHIAGQSAWEKAQDRESESTARLALAQGFEVVDIRANWRNYLAQSGTRAQDLLKDVVHLGPAGEALWLKFTLPHFQYRPGGPAYWRDWVRVHTPDGKRFTGQAGEYPEATELLAAPLRMDFVGARVDLLAGWRPGLRPGSARILIDGRPPSTRRELYAVTRGSRPPNHFQPMLRRAEVGSQPVVETWTLTFRGISGDGQDFTYDACGSVTGADGTGNGRERFVSKSGRLVIEPQWFHLPVLVTEVCKGQPYPDGTTCTFDVLPRFLDLWQPAAPAAGAPGWRLRANGFGPAMVPEPTPAGETRLTLASGLANGPHTLEIIPNGDGELPLRAIVVHRPPSDAYAGTKE